MIFSDYGFKIAVDYFIENCEVYFLTHAHFDHMKGFPKIWNRKKPLVLSQITRDILTAKGYKLSEFVITPEIGETLHFNDFDFKVTCLDANHCIGSMIFAFEKNGKKIIHTGDFKFDEGMKEHIKKFKNPDKLYLDTTYNHPDYIFPSQDDTIEKIIKIIRDTGKKEIFIGVYEIGKDKLLLSIYEIFGEPFYVPDKKYKVYKHIGLEKVVTREKDKTRFRAFSRQYLEGKYFRKPDDAIVIIPTGWSVNKKNKNGYFYIPYSEHCDYIELRNFLKFINAKNIISIIEY